MRNCLIPGILGLLFSMTGSSAIAEARVLILEGLAGNSDYAERFNNTSGHLAKAASKLGDHAPVLLQGTEATRQAFLKVLQQWESELNNDDTTIIYLVGHGSWDDETYKFNLPGPDITATELATALDALPNRQQLLINSSSASGAMVDALKKPGRVLITATRSGAERHATYFGEHFARALSDASADLNKDEVISLSEAFDYTSKSIADYFRSDNTLATEHALMTGEITQMITLAKLTDSNSSERPDNPAIARARASRNEALARVEALRLNKGSLPGENYQRQLRQAIVALALADEALATANNEAKE